MAARRPSAAPRRCAATELPPAALALAAALREAKPRNKYRARATELDGIRFDSAGEARRWAALRLLERSGAIAELERQRRFPLEVNGTLVATYVADFAYREGGELVVEDFKSPATVTAVYRLKRALVRALHGVCIRETG